MKSQDFAALLTSFSRIAKSLNANDVAFGWITLAQAFAAKPLGKSKDICASIANTNTPSCGDSTVDRLLESLAPLSELLGSVTKKEPLASNLELKTALTHVRGQPLDAVVGQVIALLTMSKPKAPRTTKNSSLDWIVIDKHVKLLEKALGDEADFNSAILSLKECKDLKLPEIKAIAKAFSGETAKSKDHAFKLIWARHASLVESRAKNAAIGGRTAA